MNSGATVALSPRGQPGEYLESQSAINQKGFQVPAGVENSYECNFIAVETKKDSIGRLNSFTKLVYPYKAKLRDYPSLLWELA